MLASRLASRLVFQRSGVVLSTTNDHIFRNFVAYEKFAQAIPESRARKVYKDQYRTLTTSPMLSAKIGTAPVEIRGPIRPSVHWTIERAVAVSMLPMYPMAFILDNPIMNFVTVTAVSLHAYWGFYEVIRDYAFERRYGPLLMPILHTIWRIVCIIGYSGFLYFNFNDIGAIGAIKKLWSV